MFEDDLEKTRPPKVNDNIQKERIGDLIPDSKFERISGSFADGVDESVVPLIEFLKNQIKSPEKEQVEPNLSENLSEYEKKVWKKAREKGEIPKVRFLVDIDGVLIDTDEKIAKLLEVFSKGSFKEVVGIVSGKIQPKELRNLFRCRNAAMLIDPETKVGVQESGDQIEERQKMRGVSLLTDRFSQGTHCFPCFNKAEREVFENHGIQVQTSVLKPFALGSTAPVSGNEDLIYYFGSSRTDQNFARRIRKNLQENGENPEKLIYIEIRQHFIRNIL